MGWEDRNGRSYYYRKERTGARVRSVYVGSGATAYFAAELDAMERTEAKQKRRTEQRARLSELAKDEELDALGETVRQLVAAQLFIDGFHQHKRQWRRKRNGSCRG
jgi:hypothetical protein